MRCRSGQAWAEAFDAPVAVLDFDGSKWRSPARFADGPAVTVTRCCY
jgi:hypothetical protein